MSWKEYKKILNDFCFRKSTAILAILIFGAVCGVIYLVENEIKEESPEDFSEEFSSASFPNAPEIKSYIGIFDDRNFGYFLV